MPFINTRTSAEISKEQEILLKEKMGKAISLIGKSESWLMLNFEDNCRLYFKGDNSKNMAIIESKNLKELKLDELIRSLLTHELMSQGKKDDEKKKDDKKEDEKKKVGIALKAYTFQSDSSEEEEDEEMTIQPKGSQDS